MGKANHTMGKHVIGEPMNAGQPFPGHRGYPGDSDIHQTNYAFVGGEDIPGFTCCSNVQVFQLPEKPCTPKIPQATWDRIRDELAEQSRRLFWTDTQMFALCFFPCYAILVIVTNEQTKATYKKVVEDMDKHHLKGLGVSMQFIPWKNANSDEGNSLVFYHPQEEGSNPNSQSVPGQAS